VHQKNPAMFNQIASYFQDLPLFEFVWIGDGVSRELLTSKNICVTGWMPVADAKEMIAEGDVYLSTANFEGMSFAVLEALAMRKPVLLTDCVGNKDLVKQGLNGDLFLNEDEAIGKITQYFNNRAMLKTMGKHSSLHCRESFDVKNTFEQYHSLYSSKLSPAAVAI
jgi:glycosyltransferase involved in cell wall biosynthesis